MEAGSRLVGSRGLKGLDVAMKSGEEEQEGQEAESVSWCHGWDTRLGCASITASLLGFLAP